MEFPKSFGLVLLVILYLFASVKAADINEVRKTAIKKLDANVAHIIKLFETTSAYVQKRRELVPYISAHWREFGVGVNNDVNFKIQGLAKSAYMMADLLKSSSDVIKCIQHREREALEEIYMQYSRKFLIELSSTTRAIEEYQNDTIRFWIGDYDRESKKYFNYHKTFVSDVQKATSESDINKIVEDSDLMTREMGGLIDEIHRDLANLHLSLLSSSKFYVTYFKARTTSIMNETSQYIDKCFPNLY